MRFLVLLSLFSIGSAFANPVKENGLDLENYLTVDTVEVSEEYDLGAGLMGNLDNLDEAMLEVPYAPENISPKEDGGISLAQIVNYGKKLWKFIVDNQPVVNVSSQSANALPRGADDWYTLQGWQAPSSRVVRITYKNAYGMSVVDFKYRLLYTWGGNLNGKGRYLSRITVIPANLDVMWGYTFNATTVVPNVVNTGTHDNPIAGAEIEIKWSVETIIKKSRSSSSYFVTGDGRLRGLSNNY